MTVDLTTGSLNYKATPAILVLEDGSVFRGSAIGAAGQTVGEVVFNTSMTGYQEILTDPSYAEQIVTLTYPHVGSTGVNSEDEECSTLWAKGLIIRDLPMLESNFRSEGTLGDYLKQHNIVAIADIDTRRLTRILRDVSMTSHVGTRIPRDASVPPHTIPRVPHDASATSHI